jgi:hypothetical protein
MLIISSKTILSFPFFSANSITYLKGNGVARDRNRGYELIFSAAKNGSREGQNFIDICKAHPSLVACN